MDIQEVRTKFPQYSDLSDTQLADALHTKFYSDIPKEKFYGDIGIKGAPAAPQQPTAQPSVASDLTQGLMTGGPVGAIMAGAKRGLGTISDTISAGANRAGETVTDLATKAGASPELAGVAGAAANTTVEAAPMLMGGAAGKMASPLFEAAGKRLMQSALKPGIKANKLGDGERAVQTLLDEGINVTKGGVEKLGGMIDDLENQMSGVLQKYAGTTVDKGAVASRIQDVVGRIERRNATPQDALKDVQKVYDDFLTNGLVPKQIPIGQAQELKKGIYQILREKYGTLSSDTVEAQKALGRGLKETINAAAPEVVPLNARIGDLANARKLAEHRTLVEGNSNIGGLAPLAHGPGAAAAFLIDKYGLSKSLLARLLYSNSNAIPMTAGAATGGILSKLNQQE